MAARVRQPTPQTLARYGLVEATWRAIARRQRGACGICRRVPPSGTLHIDHEHRRGWKRLAPSERAKYVRGLLCFRCNTALRYYMTVEWLRAAAGYLARYERRKK